MEENMKHKCNFKHIHGINYSILAVSIMALLTGCNSNEDNNNHTQSTYLEKYRPQLQYTPSKNWMNDPNGLVYSNGEYHLFYQYNPNGNSWGDMSWGHAVSKDLVHWDELNVALPVEKDTNGNVVQMFFSGSAVVDTNNSSELGSATNPPMVAMYTSYYPNTTTLPNGKTVQAGTQAQSIAYSTDKGITWTQYAGNPVIATPPTGYEDQYRDFRDPKVFWYEAEHKWVMVAVLSAQHKAVLYSSTNLKDWEFMSEFGPANGVAGVWECPDLFPLSADGDPANQKWVMIINLNPGGPAGGSGTQYFVGKFNGTTFEADQLADNTPPSGSVVANGDFEGSGTYTDLGWTTTGDLQNTSPSAGNLSGQGGVTNYQGQRLANTFINGDASTGTIVSPDFQITNKYINLMVGGGNHPHDPNTQDDATVPAGDLLFPGANFEGANGALYSDLGWVASGDFVGQPIATGAIGDQQAVSGFMGTGLVNTFFGFNLNEQGDIPTGTLTSPTFTVTKSYINFLIGGGNHPYGTDGATAVVLRVDGQVVRTATGQDLETLNWTNWDVSEYIGRQAQIEIIDENNSGWGHINADNFMASDTPAKAVSTETSVNLIVDGETVRTATGSNAEALSWRTWNVAAFEGKTAHIRIVDKNTGGWGHILADHIMQSNEVKQIANWADFGSDFYAGVSWNNVPDGKRLWLGWMSNWNYAGNIPTSPWRSAQTFVRELGLKTINNEVKLTQTPTENLISLRNSSLFNLKKETKLIAGISPFGAKKIKSAVAEINTEFNPGDATSIGFKVHAGDNGDETIIGYDAVSGEVYIDRTKSGDATFNSSFAAVHRAPLNFSPSGTVKLHIMVDTSSVTVFAGEGDVVLTDQIFPSADSNGIDMFSEGGDATLKSLTVWPLKSILAEK
ncbi:GH32 C-terminal domain-containing protein [uncultured Tolumonas sp.]|uniref:GH32 C-terminal domain-containing protein n=1 Tax=uncultured Tolumonas sp. TaxID=263765 RepID=UPI002A0A4048|nr:GH32 C-terminal domain-containing protein [uncultured Tolumonas sp.]